MTKQLLLWNSNAGNASTVNELQRFFASSSTSFVDIALESRLDATIADAVNEGCTSVIAAGGDGTIHSIVNAIMKIPSSLRPSLGILPLGTANDLAGTLNIPDDLSLALAIIERKESTPLDVIRVRAGKFERFFANVATGGNGSRVSAAMTDEIKKTWGAFCYLRGAVTVLSDLVSFNVSIECDSETLTDVNAWAVLVANGKSNAGRIMIAPEASVNDGLLDLIIVLDGTAIDMVKIASSVLQGNFLESEQVIYRKAKRVSMEAEPTMLFTLDGEVYDEADTSGPIEFEVIKHAIGVFAPSVETQSAET
jgi:diacylglycerol kinase (ATP)